MPDRKAEIADLERILREIRSKNDLCPDCGEALASEEAGLCERCTLFASYERAMEGEDR